MLIFKIKIWPTADTSIFSVCALPGYPVTSIWRLFIQGVSERITRSLGREAEYKVFHANMSGVIAGWYATYLQTRETHESAFSNGTCFKAL